MTGREKMYTLSVDDLELTGRAAKCLRQANIVTIDELVLKQRDELLKIPGFGLMSFISLIGAIQRETGKIPPQWC